MKRFSLKVLHLAMYTHTVPFPTCFNAQLALTIFKFPEGLSVSFAYIPYITSSVSTYQTLPLTMIGCH